MLSNDLVHRKNLLEVVSPEVTSKTCILNFTDYPALKNVGGSASITIQSLRGNILISVVRTEKTKAFAVNMVCTHLGCVLNSYDRSSQTYSCPCYGSTFSVDGTVQAGPANTSLQTYPTQVKNKSIVITVA